MAVDSPGSKPVAPKLTRAKTKSGSLAKLHLTEGMLVDMLKTEPNPHTWAACYFAEKGQSQTPRRQISQSELALNALIAARPG